MIDSIVIGHNDIVNPAAQDDPNSPIAGISSISKNNMPKCPRVLKSKNRSFLWCRDDPNSGDEGTGYSGIENPLFFKENTRMLYGDAKASLDKLLSMID